MYQLGAFWSVTYYLGLVRGVANIKETHPWWCMISLGTCDLELRFTNKRATSLQRNVQSGIKVYLKADAFICG